MNRLVTVVTLATLVACDVPDPDAAAPDPIGRVDGTAPPFGGADGRGQAPAIDGTAWLEPAVAPLCPTTVVEGLDVFQGTGTIDWAKVKASGRGFAFIKATQGDYNKQSTFVTNWANAATAGVLRSAYHFFDPTISGTAQAQAFLAELALGGGMTDNDLPPLVDIECPISTSETTSDGSGSGCEYPGNSGWVATATMQSEIFDYLAAVEAATHRKPILYSYTSWFGSLKFTDARLASYPLFIASPGTCANIPAPWTTATFWQYSSTGTVPGVSGKADVDRYIGSAGDLTTWNAGTIERDAGVVDAGVPGGDASVAGDGALADRDAGTTTTGKHGGCAAGGDGGGALLLLLVTAGLVRRRALLRG